MNTPRHQPDWNQEAIRPDTFEALIAELEVLHPGRVRRAVDILSGAISKTIDNQADAQETLRRIGADPSKGATPAPSPGDPAITLEAMFHDTITGMQSAWIEWQHGGGAEQAMAWIHNYLLGPGLIPEDDAPYSKEAQAWFDANRSHPFPACYCLRPSNIGYEGLGACCHDHMEKEKADRKAGDES